MRTPPEVHEAGGHATYPIANCPICTPEAKRAEADRYEILADECLTKESSVHFLRVASKLRAAALRSEIAAREKRGMR
jgi:hypothetical protein